jgi:hypothetical protein
MKKEINDLLLKMQTGENCIGETANQLLHLFAVSNSLPSKDGKDYSEKSMKQISTHFTQENFINSVKNNSEFSERWGLKIEERELTYSERYKIWFTNNFETGMEYCEDVKPDFDNEYYEPTPTKLITVTYNDKKLKSKKGKKRIKEKI